MTMQDIKTKPTYGYYRQPDKWITASPSTDTDELRYRRDGWEPLRQYGFFEMSTPYMAANPLEPLFMRGGVHELCDDQVRTLYMAPPLVPGCGKALGQDHKHHEPACMASAKRVVFPQLEHMKDLGPFPCLFDCGRVLPTVEARNQHTSVMHGPEKSDERTGKSLAAALIAGGVTTQGGGGGSIDSSFIGLVAEMKERMEQLQAELAALKASKPRRRRRTSPKTAELSV